MSKYEKFASGIFVVRADNANFNADFSGMPRTLPDGTIFATDKALKYCIRKYIHDLTDKGVFVWKRFQLTNKKQTNEKESLGVLTLDSNIEVFLGKDNIKSPSDFLKNLLKKAVDIRLFGATIAAKGVPDSKKKKEDVDSSDKQENKSKTNYSICGPCQITYGVDKFGKGEIISSTIQSPYADKSEFQSTLGSQSRVTEAHYVYDFTINPNNLLMDEQLKTAGVDDSCFLQKEDVELFKEAIRLGVNYVTSTTKIGALAELLLFVEYNINREVPLVQTMKNHVKIDTDTNGIKRRITIDLFPLSQFASFITNLELYYDPSMTEIDIKNSEKLEIKKLNICNNKEIKE